MMRPMIGGLNAQTPPTRNFGVLKARSARIKPAEDNVIRRSYEGIDRYTHMTNDQILEILDRFDLKETRKISRYFFLRNGTYARAVRYLSDLYRFDYYIYPDFDLDDTLNEAKQKKTLKLYNKVLAFFDNSDIQLMSRRWAIEVVLQGAYYGYICDDVPDKLVVQDLPIDYCRARFQYRGQPLVEFNVKYFEDVTRDKELREKILLLFPKEFQVGWRKYENGKLKAEDRGDQDGWIVLDKEKAFKFNFNDSDFPPLAQAIPAIINLEETQDLNKELLVQKLQKLLVQQFELDSQGHIPFQMNELQQLNQNAIDMVGEAVGINVLSTVAGVNMFDVSGDVESTADSQDGAENQVYNDMGISQNLFNTEGNTALEKSVAVDEAYVKPLLLQIEGFLNRVCQQNFDVKGLPFRVKMLHNSIFNYTDLSDKYKDLTKIGFSRFLPMLCFGHTQKEVISMAKLEQQIMQLDAYMLPPFSSNTMSSETWAQIKEIQKQVIGGATPNVEAAVNVGEQMKNGGSNSSGNSSSSGDSENGSGRPELPDDQKSEKTLANRESSGQE